MRTSVVIPAYNAESTLAAALGSVVGHAADMEVIVVDDGSTDATARVVATFGDHVRLLSTPNRGVSAARNTGISESNGGLVAFLDADDLWLPGKLARQWGAMRETGADASYTGKRTVGPDLAPLQDVVAEPEDDLLAALLWSCVIPISSLVVRREVLVEIGGFDETYMQCADWELFLRLARGASIVAVPDPLILYRLGSTRMSSDVGRLERESTRLLDEFFAEPAVPHGAERDRIIGHNWSVLAGTHLGARNWRDAVRCLATSARLHPPSAAHAFGLPIRRLRRLVRR